LDAGYPIYVCRMRDGEKIYDQVEVEYRQDDRNPLLPNQWTYTTYRWGNPKSFCTQVFRTQTLKINTQLSADHFEYPLKPGMLVFEAGSPSQFQVLEDGSLGPRGSYHPNNQSGRTWLWLGLTAAVLIWGAFGWLYVRRSRARLAS